MKLEKSRLTGDELQIRNFCTSCGSGWWLVGGGWLSRSALAFTLAFTLASTSLLPAQSGAMTTYVSTLMAKMTLEEKIGQLNLLTQGGTVPTGSAVSTDVEAKIKKGQVGGIFGLTGPEKVRLAQDLAMQSRLKIPLIFGLDVIHGYKTVLPIPLAMSCSWDTSLIRQAARLSAIEASADGICWTFSPMVDIARDPRWGRVAEGPGEDPFLGSEIAKAYVRGYQGRNMSGNDEIMACVKHFALYGASEAGRDYNTVDMSRGRMFNDYLPPYKATVEAGVGSVMSSFNDVEGIPASGNKWLLTDVLRNLWGFKGLTVSDYTSINEMSNHGLGDLQAVSVLALKAGLNMDMVGEGYLSTLQKSLKEKKISQAMIDEACRKVLEAKYKLGLFKDPYKYIDENRQARILSTANRAEARSIAARSMVLLKNENQILPLKQSGSIALVGPLADDRRNMLGTWAVSGNWEHSVAVLEGIRNLTGGSVQIHYAKGCNITDDESIASQANVFGERVTRDARTSQVMIDEAVAAAMRSDVIVAVLGEASELTGEASSMSTIDLPRSQKNLVEALIQTGKPLVLVLMSGRPMTIEPELMASTACLQAWFGGVESGNALADVLFGRYNPSGKLSMTLPKNVGQIPIYYSIRHTGRPYRGEPFRKFKSNYLDVSNEPLLPFGYGLSYSRFEYGTVNVSKNKMKAGEKIIASVSVKNTGSYDGEETVQLYLSDLVASVTRPVKELKGFKKLFLRAGEERTVEFEINTNLLKFYNYRLAHVAESGEFRLGIGGDSGVKLETPFILE